MERIVLLLSFLSTICFGQIERWVYRYGGIGTDEAYSLVYGADGNLYAAGASWSNSTGNDFTVISLSNSGTERWVYKYNGLLNYNDQASTIVYGNGDIYVGGSSYGSDTINHLTVISLTPDGTERWIYKFHSPTTIDGYANQIIYAPDGNIYVVGAIKKINTGYDIIVISLTEGGAQRWVYTYTGPSQWQDCGNSIIYGVDSNIYIAGFITNYSEVFTVISLTNSGTFRWMYQYSYWSDALCLGCGPDSNLYAIGNFLYGGQIVYSTPLAISLNNSGIERWVYTSTTSPASSTSGVLGADGNIYLAGSYGWDIPFLLVESVSDSGDFRWRYIDTTWGYAKSIIYGNDGNIYACGLTSDTWQGGETYFTVVSLTNLGAQRWMYRKNLAPESYWDIANSIVYGLDGNIYAAGQTVDNITGGDFTVISLNPTGIEEDKVNSAIKNRGLKLDVLPNIITRNALIHYALEKREHISLAVYDIGGRKVAQIADGIFKSGIYAHNLDASNLSSGIYFLVLEGEKETKTQKILLVR